MSDLTVGAEAERVLVPRVPALVAGFREVLWLSPEGEIEALSPEEARARLDPVQGGETPMVCHARAVARRLDIPSRDWAGFAAFDLLELFAFVRPAQFCVPTPRMQLSMSPTGSFAQIENCRVGSRSETSDADAMQPSRWSPASP